MMNAARNRQKEKQRDSGLKTKMKDRNADTLSPGPHTGQEQCHHTEPRQFYTPDRNVGHSTHLVSPQLPSVLLEVGKFPEFGKFEGLIGTKF